MILTRPLEEVFFARRCVGEFSWFHCSASRASLIQVRAMLFHSCVRSLLGQPSAFCGMKSAL